MKKLFLHPSISALGEELHVSITAPPNNTMCHMQKTSTSEENGAIQLFSLTCHGSMPKVCSLHGVSLNLHKYTPISWSGIVQGKKVLRIGQSRCQYKVDFQRSKCSNASAAGFWLVTAATIIGWLLLLSRHQSTYECFCFVFFLSWEFTPGVLIKMLLSPEMLSHFHKIINNLCHRPPLNACHHQCPSPPAHPCKHSHTIHDQLELTETKALGYRGEK